MRGGALAPPEVPPGFWQRADVRDALRGHDMGALFSLLNRYAALSQIRIGTAVELNQGRVGEVMKGTRRISGLNVFQRIADGLGMPDDCRLLLGVSSRRESLIESGRESSLIAWQDADMRRAWRTRDFRAVFHLAYRAGMTQETIAESTGLPLDLVLNVMKGNISFGGSDTGVAEQVAAGLGVPHDMRGIFGLAPKTVAIQAIPGRGEEGDTGKGGQDRLTVSVLSASVDIPAEFWDEPETVEALRTADTGKIFALILDSVTVSQTLLGGACGLDQGKVSEIIRGIRKPDTLSVLNRIANGLNMPDHARVIFGLAPKSGNSVTAMGNENGEGNSAAAFERAGKEHPVTSTVAGIESIARLAIASPEHLQEILIHLNEQWHALVKTDNLLGPRFALAGVLNQISVIQALRSILRDEQRIEVVRLGAKYAESAAWLYEETGNTTQARSLTSQAMEWAYEGNDERMLAWTIFRRSQQAAAIFDAAQAIGLAQAARRDEEKLATPTRAAIRVQEAYGHALDGNNKTAQRLLDEAHNWAAGDTVGDAHEGHGSYCTPGYIEIQRASCWLATGQPKKAIKLYEDSLRTLPTVYQRNRAATLTRLAVAYAADNQPEQAASIAHAALPVAQSAGSKRLVSEIENVGAELTPHRALPAIAALLDELNAEDR